MHLIPKALNSSLTNKTIKVTKIFLNPDCDFASNIKRIFKIPLAQDCDGTELLCYKDLNEIENRFGSEKIQDAYILYVEEEKITIKYAEYNGLVNALSTLEQLLFDLILGKEYARLSTGVIFDSPKYSYRGLLVDVSRHYRTVEELKKTIHLMSFYKLNFLHLHLTDDQGWRIEIKKYPKLTNGGNIRKSTQLNRKGKTDSKEYGEGLFYTQDDLKSLVNYARDFGIEIVPEIDVPGHLLGAISQYPELSCSKKSVDVRIEWGVEKVIACASNPKTVEFIKDVIDEVCDIFPCRYFHIGGDEVPKDEWKACKSCQSKMKELGLKNENELQGWLTDLITEYLNGKGKQAIIWDENLNVSIKSNSTVTQLWSHKLNKSQSKEWIKNGNKMLISYCHNFYFDYPYGKTSLKKTYSFSGKLIGLKPQYEKNVLGMEAAMWSEWMRDIKKFDFMLYPRMQAFAENCWCDKLDTYKDFEKRLKIHLEYLSYEKICYCPLRLCNPSGIIGLKQKHYSKSKISDTYDEMRLANLN